jgi:hypothetical protein
MATFGTLVNLLDLSKRVDPNGKVMAIAELLSQTNEVLADMPWKEGNLPTGEKTTVRTGIPTATWRKLNYGVAPTKSVTAQVTDSCGMLEAYSEIDKSLADLNGNTAEFRLSEDRAFLEGMNQQMASTLFYGDTSVNPERYVGLAPRFSATSAGSGANIIKGVGNSSTNTSIWLVGWGSNTAYGIYPKGSKAGFSQEDLGQVTLLDAQSGRYEGYRTHYKWDCGLTVRDWRYIVRIANVDVAALTKNAGTGDDIIDLMTQALEKIYTLQGVTPAFYVNRTVSSFLRRQTVNKVASGTLSFESVGGKRILMFGEVPVRRCDQILSTEATVS